MKTSSLIWLVTGIVVIVSLLAVWFYPSIQEFMAGNAMWNGIHDFSRQHNTIDLQTLNALPADAAKSVMLSIPYMDYNQQDLDRIYTFVASGNVLVIMDDFGYGNQVVERLGLQARFNGKYLLDPLFCYKNEYLPRIVEFDPPIQALGIQALTLNHATCLENTGGGRVLAWSSLTSFIDANGNGSRDVAEKYGPFPVAAEYQVGLGTVRMVGDPSLIINSMLGQNDNLKFTDYLLSTQNPAANIYLDYSHISQSPLDMSKRTLAEIRIFLSNPYVTIGLIALVFTLAAVYIFKRGEIFG